MPKQRKGEQPRLWTAAEDAAILAVRRSGRYAARGELLALTTKLDRSYGAIRHRAYLLRKRG